MSVRSSRITCVLRLAFAVLLCQGVGGLGALFTASSVRTWYPQLAKPAFTPPGWIFGVVWPVLYCLMGVAWFLVWQGGWERREVRQATAAFFVQLALNLAWSLLFFGLRSPLLGLLEMLALGAAIGATMALFSRVSRVAAWLLVPYLAWVGFALLLNYSIWRLNP